MKWPTVPLWTTCTINDEVLPEDTDPEYEFAYIDISNVSTRRISDNPETLRFAAAPSRARRIARPGDVVVSTVRTYLRAIAGVQACPYDRVFSTGFAVVRPLRRVIDPSYLAHLLTSSHVVDEIEAISTGVSYPATTATDIARLRVPLPDLDDQRKIADYLDHETAEMDAMSSDLDDLISLLIERYFAEIAGGVGWGAVDMAPVGLSGSIVLGKMLQPTRRSEADQKRPYLRAAHVQPKGVLDMSVDMKNMWFAPAESETLDLIQGDVVVVEGGVGGYGRAAYVSEDLPGVGFQNSIVRIRPYADFAMGRFIAYALVSARRRGLIEVTAATATMPHFTAEKVARFRVPFPPLDEQRRIVARLDDETAKIDAMIADAQELKNLIAERRSALITEVVTGRKEI